MKLDDYKLIFLTVGLIGILLIASPVLADIISPQRGEPFSQLYLLGPEHRAENYPFNVKVGESYFVYLGVANHMESSVYYKVCLKFRNQTEPRPDNTLGIPSSLDSLYEYKFALADGQVLERMVPFSIDSASVSGNVCRVNSLNLNGRVFSVNKPSVWNANTTVFYYQLFFELWIYSSEVGEFTYHNRAVDLQLNVTSTRS